MVISPLKIISTIVCILLVVGYANRRRAKIHVPLMLICFLTDLGIVVYIEVMRGAVASAQAKMSPLMVVHIIISVVVLVLYFVQVGSGIRNVRRASGAPRSVWHRRGGKWLLITRLGNLVTSFIVG
jgi:cytochrome c oxidase assembly factor CtaG